MKSSRVDRSVKVGVADQGEHDFNLAGRQAGDHAISAVGVADAITETARQVVRPHIAADDGRLGSDGFAIGEAVGNPLFDGCDRVVSGGVVDDDAIVADVERAVAGERQRCKIDVAGRMALMRCRE